MNYGGYRMNENIDRRCNKKYSSTYRSAIHFTKTSLQFHKTSSVVLGNALKSFKKKDIDSFKRNYELYMSLYTAYVEQVKLIESMELEALT